MRGTVRRMLALLAGAIFVFSGSIHAQTYNVCLGENWEPERNKCTPHEVDVPCGTNMDDWASVKCKADGAVWNPDC